MVSLRRCAPANFDRNGKQQARVARAELGTAQNRNVDVRLAILSEAN